MINLGRTVVLLCLISTSLNVSGLGEPGRSRKKTTDSRPLELRGSKEQRIRQNIRANNLDLDTILNDEELASLVSLGRLTELVGGGHYYIDRQPEKICTVSGKARGKVRYKVRYAKKKIFVRPAVKKYLDQLAGDNFTTWHNLLKITSGARSLEKQKMISSRGSPCYTAYAVATDEPLEQSLHLRGIVVDISRRVAKIHPRTGRHYEIAMSSAQIKWLRNRLIRDKLAGLIEAEEESGEFELLPDQVEPIEEKVCYHIAVFPRKPIRP